MINLNEYLLENVKGVGSFAIVTYDDKVEPVWFGKFDFGEGDLYFESPCWLNLVSEVGVDVDAFCERYVEPLEFEGCSRSEYIEHYVKPMIVDGNYYEIENMQVSPYLPKVVQGIKLVSEVECLMFLLEVTKCK